MVINPFVEVKPDDLIEVFSHPVDRLNASALLNLVKIDPDGRELYASAYEQMKKDEMTRRKRQRQHVPMDWRDWKAFEQRQIDIAEANRRERDIKLRMRRVA